MKRVYLLFILLMTLLALGSVNGQGFVTTWKTDNTGTSEDNEITIPTTGSGYDYTIDWGDGNSDMNVTGDITHTYGSAGTYTVTITGDFPRIYFNNGGDKEKLLTIEEWGNIAWSDMAAAFRGCSNLDINATDAPDLSGVTNLAAMFSLCTSLSADLNHWNVSNITSMLNMFFGATSFNQSLNAWNVSNVTNMQGMFQGASIFNGNITSWNTANVTNMNSTFRDASAFNQNISGWDVSSVTNMESMFEFARDFLQPIGSWNVSAVTNMESMFEQAIFFNEDLSSWNVGNVTNFERMFLSARAFDQPIGSWDVSSGTHFSFMFLGADDFNSDITSWNVGAATHMISMFKNNPAFNQDLSSWNVSNVSFAASMFETSGLSKSNYDKILEGWSQLTLQNNVSFGAQGVEYCNGSDDRQSIIDNFSWTITDAGEVCNDFITTWKTDNTGTSEDNEITIPTTGSGYDYTIDWGDGNSDMNVTGDITHTYSTAGTYTVSITGAFPRIYFNNGGDKEKLLTIEQWGDIAWSNMESAFYGCSNMNITATDAPDLSGVTSLNQMLRANSTLNADIDHWDVSTITSMQNLFAGASSFNQDLNSWDVSNVTTMSGTFSDATVFNGNITNWDVSNVNSMLGMFFKNHHFNQPIGNWDVSSVTNMTSVFRDAQVFNQDISNWNVSSVTTFSLMFDEAEAFNQDISGWNTSAATTMSFMFRKASLFNQPIGTWDVSAVTNMDEMFAQAEAFNQDLNSWDVSSVTNMGLMFRFAYAFNGNITSWNVSNVTNMSFMFNGATAFNQDISGWDVSSVTFMNGMFYNAPSFNQPIGSWNVSSVTNLFNTFRDASAFNQDISGWDVSSVTDMTNFLNTSGFSKANYDRMLDGWSQLTLQNNVTFGASGIEYCYGADARQSIIDNFNWTITDAGEVCNDFITTWKTDNTGTSNDDQITISTYGTGFDFDYTIDWGDGNSDTGVTGDITHTYATAGTYTVSISGDFPNIYFLNGNDKEKILSIEQWGDIQWGGSINFWGCTNLINNATDAPNLSIVTSLASMFRDASSFDGDLNHWDVSNITNMFAMFRGARAFNGDISDWDVSNVTNMQLMLAVATDFNQDISGWDVSNVTTMREMLANTYSFNQDIGGWDVSSVTDMEGMFGGADIFNQDISGWDVSNVTSLSRMFTDTDEFNVDISGWNVSSNTNMDRMFLRARAFNQDISTWDVSSVTNMDNVFLDADDFNQNLADWDVSNVTSMINVFSGTSLSKFNYDKILDGWSQLTLQSNVTFGAVDTEYCNGADARQSIIDNFSWTISDAGEVCDSFITTWKTDNTGTSNDDQITIPTTGTGYDYTVDWGDGNTDTGITGDITHTYSSAGTYTVMISGDFPRIYFNDASDEEKLLTVEQWGDIQWSSMQNAFAGCRNMRITATDAPDLSAVTDMSNMFKDCIAFNDPIDHWDVSNIENMSSTFRSAINFNQDLNSWDVSNVTTFSSTFIFGGAFNGNISSWDVSSATNFIGMFNRAHVFNQDISNWDVSNATQLAGMFFQAFAFDQDISGWDVSNATNLANMFREATSFNQPIGSWDISSATNIDGMFQGAEAFNQDIDGWDVSNAVNVVNMFRGALSFNQDLNSWDMSGLSSLSGLFFGASSFNGKIDSWDVSNVTNFGSVFKDAIAFNQDISGWNVSAATSMIETFSATSAFDQNLGGWDVSNVMDMTNMLTFSGLSKSNYDKLLNGWSALTLQNNVPFRTSSQYCYGADARQSIIDNFSWTFTDAGEVCNGFITTWKTDNTGTSNDDQITIPTTGTGYDYTVDWGDGNSDTGVTGDITHTYSSAGTYTVTISGDFPRIYFNNGGDKEKLLTIEQWGDIQWTSMRSSFFGCTNLTSSATDSPDLSEVTDLFAMFFQATAFNGDIGNWDVSNVTNMQSLFGGATSFNQDIGDWDVSNVTNLTSTFFNTPFNQDIGDWDVSSVTTMRNLFQSASSFNQDIGGWDVSNVTDMNAAFVGASSFNGDISSWDVGSATTMKGMFQGASAFNQDLSTWDVSSVIDFEQMFNLATSFNQDLNAWDVSSATTMKSMFENATVFNGNIGDWNVSNVVLTNRMFLGAANFNHDLSDWDVSSVTNMSDMFSRARAFNGDIENWDVSAVTNMVGMFYQADVFSQNLGNWDVSNVTNMTVIFEESGLTKASYDRILAGWSQLTLQSNVTFDATGIDYCFGATARQSIIDNFNWTITDGVESCQDFITTWKTDNTGGSNDDQITIPTTGTGYDYTVDWGDGNSDTGVTGDITHTYASAGTYTVTIAGDFPRIYFEGADDPQKILTVEQWGDIQWTSMERAFSNCSNLDITATDAPDLSEVTNMVSMFVGASSMNGAIGHWDMSNVEDISGMFFSASSFNQPLNDWDVSNVTKMNAVFSQAPVFNQDLNEWDVSNVEEMGIMFNRAFDFNGDISSWDVSNVNRMNNMFTTASDFNQNIGNWDVSSVTTMRNMFYEASAFNQNIDAWDVSNVADFYAMFFRANSFNQDLNNWDLASATTIQIMFGQNTAFNGDISGWDVSNVTNFGTVFASATAFNRDISGWDVSNGTQMDAMFSAATAFNQDISGWDVQNMTYMLNALNNSGISSYHYDKILDSWSQQTLQNGVDFGAEGLEYCNSSAARQSIIDNFGWTITDGGENCIVNIPDANFKAALLANTSINTTDDGEISIQEAQAVTNFVDVRSQDIADLTGIEAFVNVKQILVDGNSLTSIDLSSLSKLERISVKDNQLTALNTSNNPLLWEIESGGNQITSLDLSNNPELTTIQTHENNLTVLDVSNNPKLFRITAFSNDISSIDLSNNPLLETINFESNQLTSIDVSELPVLVSVKIRGNGTSLVSANLANGNNTNFVGAILLDQNPNLTCITVDDPVYSRENWTFVDDPDVFRFSCDFDEIVNIPDANFKAALLANTEINTTDDGEITVGEADAFTGRFTANTAGISDVTGIEYFQNITEFVVPSNSISTVDLSNNPKLRFLGINNNNLTSLDVSSNELLEDLRCYNNAGLSDLDLSDNPQLAVLWIANNSMMSLDVSNNPLLGDVWASGGNSFSTVDFSNNPNLFKLLMVDNDLTSLDLSQNPLLEDIRISNNDLSSLDLRNGANELITNFEAGSNPDLTCISVDDPAYSTANWTDIDAASAFKFSCDPNEIVDIPDANFKSELLGNTSINTTDDGEITYGEAEAFTGTIDINNLGTVNEVTGVEAFINLTGLLVSGNNLTTIDVSNLLQLEQLNVTANDLTDLDLSNNSLLNNLSTPQNDLGALDLSNNPELSIVNISASGLSDIDISANTNLTLFWAAANDLTSIDLSSNTTINNLILSDNQIPSLDLSGLTLTRLEVRNLGLESLNIKNGANTSLTTFDATGNSALTCITVDDVTYAETNFTNIDSQTSFDLDCFTNAEIIGFELAEQTGAATIDSGNGTIDIEVNYGTDVSSLTPTIALLNENGSLSPTGAQNFTDPVIYTVTAEDGSSTKSWTATVTEAPSNETDILTFVFAEQSGPATIDIDNHTVDIEVVYTTDLTSLSPTITLSEGATIDPLSGVARDFSSSVTYTVTAEDGTTQDWTVTVTEAPSNETDILTFVFAEQTGDATIDSDNHTVDIEVAYTTDLTSLTPTITVSENTTIDPLSGVARDFSSSVTYTVTAEDGTTQDWTVAVTEAPSNETDILTFVLTEQTGDATINNSNHTIDVEVAYTTDLTSLIPTITVSENATIDPLSGVERDFSSSVTYTVTAEDGTTQDWTVTVTEAPSNETDILTFVLAEQTGDATIDSDNHTVDIEVAYQTDLTSLTPTITISANALISPESGISQDFSSSVTYTVTAEDGSTQDWTVTVTEAPSNETDITAFSFNEQTSPATIDADNHTVQVEVANGTDVTSIIPAISVSAGASIDPTGIQDFTNAVTYTVTAEDGTTQDWEVTVTVEAALGLEQETEVSIYPNPATDWLSIESGKDVRVKLMDLEGKIINMAAGRMIKIDLRSVQPGLYLLLIDDGIKLTQQKILKAN